MTTEFVDALEATRAYEANVGVIEVTKNLTEQTLRIIA
jgi:flagellar basal-body rod protein FlgC